ncbi:hypothetical protein C9E82_00150 [Paracoccus siganidrum]|nr:hypothetical protein C9E82_00150 [Paracoccus siganidrum]
MMMFDNDPKPGPTDDARLQAAGRHMPVTERALIADKLRLALDEIETGAGDFRSIREAVRYQREAIRASHRRLERLGGEA